MHAHWAHVGRGAAGLGAARGIGRFAYTPILPLMTTQVALAPQAAGAVSTANYVGYLAGALAGTASPRLARSTIVAGGAGRTGDHPGGNAAAAQHNWMAVVADSRGIRHRGGVRDCSQLDAGSPAPHLPGWGGHILGGGDQTEFVRLTGQRRLARRRVGRCPVGGTVGVAVRALVASDPARGSAAFAGVRNRTARPGSGGRRGPDRSSPVRGHLHRGQHDGPGSRTPARIPRRRGVAD
jgi:hypothetical protein